MFKTNDTVRCVNRIGQFLIELGETYRVLAANSEGVQIRNRGGMLFWYNNEHANKNS